MSKSRNSTRPEKTSKCTLSRTVLPAVPHRRVFSAFSGNFGTLFRSFALPALLLFLVSALPQRAWGAEEGDEEEQVTSTPSKARLSRPKMDVVQDRFFYKKSRVELFPHVFGVVLSNSFAYRFVPFTGFTASYHLNELLSGEVTLDYFTGLPGYNIKSLTESLAIYLDQGSLLPEIPEEQFYAGVALSASPVYGKLNLVSSHVQNFDLSFSAGLGVIAVRMAKYLYNTDDQGYVILTLDPEESRQLVKPAPSIGVSTRLFFTHWLTVRVDLRGHGYLDQVTEFDVTGNAIGTRQVFRPAVVLNTGVTGFFPFESRNR